MTALTGGYRQHRARMIAYGRWDPFVPAGRTVAHIRMLTGYGMGPRRIATLAGLGETAVDRILGIYEAPVTKVRPATEAAILAVRPDLASLNPGAVIDGCGTRRRLQGLICNGWSVNRLAAHMGCSRTSVTTWLTAVRVPAKAAQAVAAAYDQLWDKPPPGTTAADRLVAGRARKLASAAGWGPPSTWDDDEIDDPAAVPYSGRRSSRRSQADTYAEISDLMSLELTPQQIAWRTGMTYDYVLEVIRRLRPA